MPYNCQLVPPHVNADGTLIQHKNRKECLAMGLHNRGTETHPEKYSPPVLAPEASVVVATPTPETAPLAKRQDQPKKGLFRIHKQVATAQTEGEAGPEAAKATIKWTGNLSSETTTMFWSTLMSLFKGGIQWFDNTIHAKKPYDTSKLDFTRSEEEMIGEALPGPTTRLMKWLGLKSEAQAEAFIHGLVIVRIFGRIFIGVGAHIYDELKERNKEKAKKVPAWTKEENHPPLPAVSPPLAAPEPNPQGETPSGIPRRQRHLRRGLEVQDDLGHTVQVEDEANP